MDFVVGTGKSLTVTVTSGAPGTWKKKGRRNVYAIGYEGGDSNVLVADDTGNLVWLKPGNYSVATT